MLRVPAFVLVLAAIGVCCLGLQRTSAAPPRYSVTDLSSQIGDVGLMPTGINNYGQVIGYSLSSNVRTVLWTPSKPNATVGSVTDLGLITVSDINDYGQVAGFAGRAHLWTPLKPNGVQGTTIGLGTLADGPDSYAMAINNEGQVTGHSGTDPLLRVYRSFLWTPHERNGMAGSMVDLGSATIGATFDQPTSINSHGQVLGLSINPNEVKTFLWTPAETNGAHGTMTDLSTLPGASTVRGIQITDTGQVVGSAVFGQFTHAFLWTPSASGQVAGLPLDLGAFPNSPGSYALDVNVLGQVVGSSYLDTGWHAFLWTSADGMLDLSTRLDPSGSCWEIEGATALNNNGQIVAYGYDGSDRTQVQAHLLLLTPVPEPAAGLLLLATAGLLARRGTKSN